MAAVFLQEHNLKPALAVYLKLHARRHHRVLWLARYAPANNAGGKGHGTAIAIPFAWIRLNGSQENRRTRQRPGSLDRSEARNAAG